MVNRGGWVVATGPSVRRRPAVSVTADTRAMLRDRAAAVLRGNDAGGWTKASPASVPAPVELGQRVHRDRMGAPGRPAGHDRARAAVRGAVGDGHGAAPRVPGGPGRAVLSRAGVVGLRRLAGGARAPYEDDRDLPAAGACPGAAADLAADAAGAAAGDPRAPSGALPADGQLASLPRHPARPRGIRAGHHLPPVGGHGQLPALGPRAGAHHGSQARPVHPRGHPSR